ncbi:MAG: divalent-cation tolerance protein CutA [Thermoplasmatota archaeon]
MPSEPLVLVRTTVASDAQAQALARALVEEGLAACVHTSAVYSTYRWDGKLEQEREVLVEARTTPDRELEVRHRMAKGHPYELPLIESFPVEANREYARWASGPTG